MTTSPAQRKPFLKGWSPLDEAEKELFHGRTQLTRTEWAQVVALAKDKLAAKTGYRIPP